MAIISIGWKVLGVLANLMIPRWTAAFPARIGSQDPETICHSTGIDIEPNVTAHLATPKTGIGVLLYGFNLTFDGTMRLRRFQRLAWTEPHTETLAPVSAIGVPTLLLTTTDARKSLCTLDFQDGSTLFFGVPTRLMSISYSSQGDAAEGPLK